MEQSSSPGWDTFVLEVTVVVAFATVATIFTVEFWLQPLTPMIVSGAGLLLFALYRIASAVVGSPARESASTQAETGRRDTAEIPSPEGDNRSDERPGTAADIDLDQVDEHVLEVGDDGTRSSGGRRSSGDASETDFIDFDDALQSGLVSKPPSARDGEDSE